MSSDDVVNGLADVLPDCLTCISLVINRDPSLARCPMCRHSLTMASLLELPPDQSEWIEPRDETKPIKSAKIEELVKYLKAFDTSEKTLVFSQFTTFLDHVATSLKEQGIGFVRFDGSMSAKQVSVFSSHRSLLMQRSVRRSYRGSRLPSPKTMSPRTPG